MALAPSEAMMLKAVELPMTIKAMQMLKPSVAKMELVGTLRLAETLASCLEKGTPPSRAEGYSCLEDIMTICAGLKQPLNLDGPHNTRRLVFAICGLARCSLSLMA